MNGNIEIAGITVEKGTKKRGYLRVGPYFYHKRAYIRRFELIPLTIINGKEDGPTLVQTGGTHPTEYSGIDATMKLANLIKPEELKGTFIGVPCINTLGFYERTYINPIDGKNIQGLYPGKSDGTISDQIAYKVFNEIILKADYFLDCHGSDIHESNLWNFTYYATDDEVEKKSLDIGRASGIKYLHKSIYPGALGMEAARKHKIGGLYELCSGDRLLPEESSAIVDGTLNIMRHIGMLEGEKKDIKNQPGTTDDQKEEIWASSKNKYFTKKGLYHQHVKPGDLVEKDQVVGVLTNLWGDIIEEIKAPAKGRVAILIHNPVANPGDAAIIINSTETDLKPGSPF